MFRVKPHEARPLTWWNSNRGSIDFEPVYQRRGELWSPTEKAYLIDSILNEYDIPKIYLADFTLADSPLNVKKRMYAIIDGKQRFEAIFDFFRNKLPLNSDFVYQRNPGLCLSGLRYNELRSSHPEVCKTFDDYVLTVMSVATDQKGKIEDLFIRLNKTSKPLSGAELRNAMPGVVPVLARELAEHALFASKIKFHIDRYQDRDVATKLLLIEYSGDLVSTKRTDLDNLAREIPVERGTGTRPYRGAAAQVGRVLDTMVTIFADQDPLLGRQGMVPVYYWFVRQHGRDHRGSIRAFLEEFERHRKENDRRARDHGPDVDPELLRYSNLKRSHNDESAMREMHDVLHHRFRRFIEG